MPEKNPTATSGICITAEESAYVRGRVEAMRAAGTLPSEAEFLAGVSVRSAQGPASAQFFDVFNDGAGPLTVSSMSLDISSAWLTWEPASFTVQPGGSQRVYVFANYQSMPPTSTTRRLLVNSNDPDESPYPNAVFLTTGTGSSLPGAFSKTTPANGSTGNPTSVTLSWGTSSGAGSYEYCIDATNDNACSGWTNAGTATSANVVGLAQSTTYYWHVRANGPGGTKRPPRPPSARRRPPTGRPGTRRA
jgi:hypothetical protein